MLSSNLVCASVFSSTKWVRRLPHRCAVRLKQVNVRGELRTVVTRYTVCFIEIFAVLPFLKLGTGVQKFSFSYHALLFIYVTYFLL